MSLCPSSAWVTVPVARPSARIRMFCLPHGGGGASAYQPWAAQLPEFIEVCPVQLPGRESRLDEPPVRDRDALVDLLLSELIESADRPYALFGHSMGALLGYELAEKATEFGLPEPLHLFASGYRSPTTPRRGPVISTLPDEEFINELIHYGGIPDELLRNREYLKLVLPAFRSDFAVTESFGTASPKALRLPVAVFGGAADEYVTGQELHAWREVTTGTCTIRTLPGGHFYLREAASAVLTHIADELALDLELSH
ncbi:thioesterase II family protein [Streptomyces sioyaensis]|uniref:thioesterase II family protein n=1 Tax=Streptomyces sioyaensis TaxID=67364 RepID=UPI0037BDFF96